MAFGGSGTIGFLNVLLGLDSSGFQKGLDQAESRLDRFSGWAKNTGRTLSTFVTAPIVGMGIAGIKLASDLNESMSAVNTVFGESAAIITATQGSVAKTLGITRSEALASASALGALYQGAGLATPQMAAFTNQTQQAAADLASFYNVPVAQALDDIRSGLVGETEPLRKYGILLSAATVDQYAWTHGIAENGVALTEQQKLLARQGLIMDSLGAANGDFARTSGSVANQMKIVTAQFKDFLAQLGTVLLPIVSKVLTFLSKLADRFAKLSPRTQKWILIIAAAAAALGPLLVGLGFVASALSALAPAFLLLLGPVGLIIAALAALGIAYKTNLFGFRDAVNAIVGPIVGFVNQLREAFGVNGLSGVLAILATKLDQAFGGAATGVIIRFLQEVIDQVQQFVAIIQTAVSLVGALFSGDWARAWELFQQLVDQAVRLVIDNLLLLPRLLLDIFRNVDWGAVVSGIGDLGGRAFDWIKGTFDQINWGELISNAGDLLWNLGGDLIGGLKKGVDWVWDNGIKPFFGTVGSLAVEGIGDLASTLLQKGRDLLTGLNDGIADGWKFVSFFLLNLGLTIALAVPDLAATLIEKGKDLLAGLASGIVLFWNMSLQPWLVDLAVKVLAAVPDMLATLLQKGKDLLTGFHDGFVDVWNSTIQPWLADIGNMAFSATATLTTTLLSKGRDLLAGFKDGIDDGWDIVRFFLLNLATTILVNVPSLTTTLLQKGRDLFQGFRDGAGQKWGEIVVWLFSTGDRAAGAVGSLGGVLWAAGRSLMDGLYSGIAAGWERVKGLLSSITSQIPDFKGPKARDLKLLYGPGQWVMEGFSRGLWSKVPALRSDLSAITSMVGGAPMSSLSVPGLSMVGAGGGSLGTTTHGPTTITINVNGAGDARAVADEVFHQLTRAVGLREGM